MGSTNRCLCKLSYLISQRGVFLLETKSYCDFQGPLFYAVLGMIANTKFLQYSFLVRIVK